MSFDKKEYRKKYNKEYNLKNKENIKKHNQDYYKENKNELKDNMKLYYGANKEKLNKLSTEYMRTYQIKRKQIDPLYKLSKRIRDSINQSLKKKKTYKNNLTVDILGCTFEEFKQHLESQFESWMNWSNMGGKVITEQNVYWDIDHIIPISSAKTEEEVIKLNHYTNLRPLCSYVNRFIKRDKVEEAKLLV
jgi:hypothetical protein